jgi:Outer membrane protein beta-barrel domain
MKNRFLILIFLLLPFAMQAQSVSEKTFSLGFTTSPNFGWMTFPSEQVPVTSSEGLRTGFSYGVLGDFAFSSNYYFSTAFTVTSINANTKTPEFNDGAEIGVKTAAYKLQYIEIPLTLKLKSNEHNNKRFYGQFGLSTDVKISAKQDYDFKAPNGAFSSAKNADISGDINTFRLGLLFGGGAEWKLDDNLHLLTGVSYNNGLTDVLDTKEKAKNSYFTINLGVFF